MSNNTLNNSTTHYFLAAALTASFTAGCTTSIDVARLTPEVQPDGLVYYLPMARFDVEVTREIKGCFKGDEMLPDTFRSYVETEPSLITMDITATVKQRFVADAANPYLWRYPALDKKTKITSTTVAMYDNGTLKSINASADDRTGEIAGNVVKGVATLVASASGLPLPPLLPKADDSKMLHGLEAATAMKRDQRAIEMPPFCSPAVIAALNTKNLMLDKIKNSNKSLQGIRTGNQMPRECENQTELNKQACLQREITQKEEEIKIAQASVAKQLTVLRKQTQYEEVPVFTTEAATVWRTRLSLSPDDRKAWFNLEPNFNPRNQSLRPLFDKAYGSSDLEMQLQIVGTSKTDAGGKQSRSVSQGLAYRQPIDGILRIALLTPNDSSEQQTLVDTIVSVPQAGIESRLPLKNKPFDNNSLSVEFAPNGAVTAFSFNSKAGAETASRAFLENIQVIQQLREAKANEDITKLGREKALLDAETAVLNAEKARRDAQNALATDDADG